jgi:hypothetical protein
MENEDMTGGDKSVPSILIDIVALSEREFTE